MTIIYDYIIIGGGLSGLYQARLIVKHYNQQQVDEPPKILILEANDRLGGRLYSPKNHDMGGTWIWPGNDKRVLALCVELGIVHFECNDDNDNEIIDVSKLISKDYNTCNMPSQLRFIGGSAQMIHKIVKEFPKRQQQQQEEEDDDVGDYNGSKNTTTIAATNTTTSTVDVTILYQHQVTAIETLTNEYNSKMASTKVITINTKTNQQTHFMGKSITFAIPPRLIVRDVTFLNPKLTPFKKEVFLKTPIWMENASKIYLTYKEKIWIDHQLPCNVLDSFVFDVSNDHRCKHYNNYSEYNHNNDSTTCNEENMDNDTENYYSLCLFQVGRGPSSPITKDIVYTTFIKRLSQVLQSKKIISDVHDIQIHNWAVEPMTSSLVDNPITTNYNSGLLSASKYNTNSIGTVSPSFMFGNSELRKPLGENILFSSTETEQECGHMEGALKAGERVAAQSIQFVSKYNEKITPLLSH